MIMLPWQLLFSLYCSLNKTCIAQTLMSGNQRCPNSPWSDNNNNKRPDVVSLQRVVLQQLQLLVGVLEGLGGQLAAAGTTAAIAVTVAFDVAPGTDNQCCYGYLTTTATPPPLLPPPVLLLLLQLLASYLAYYDYDTMTATFFSSLFFK